MFRLIYNFCYGVLEWEFLNLIKNIRILKLYFLKERYAYLLIVSAILYLWLSITIDNPRTNWFHWVTNHILKFYCVYAICSWPFIAKTMYLQHRIRTRVRVVQMSAGYRKRVYRPRRKHNWPKVHYKRFYQIRNSRNVCST